MGILSRNFGVHLSLEILEWHHQHSETLPFLLTDMLMMHFMSSSQGSEVEIL
jgi:hypothetical protein